MEFTPEKDVVQGTITTTITLADLGVLFSRKVDYAQM